ncbi:MAG: alanine--tRNA ligase [Gammaproteobacteria bacterium]|nr:alanine--tRNA ligase [Gammaproteobacteria bacterium]
MTSSAQLRQQFLEFFKSKDHEVVASSSLIPSNDPTLLFVNAGMVQFKDTFLGLESRPYVRAVSSQRCVRAGGKHNDLENVGYTARHHTFFEMLGNFSFGDYFKEDAIKYAWEFLTQELKLPEEKLWVTVYSEDQEAENIWLNQIGVSTDRFSRIGDKKGGKKHESDNFWSMGDTGPCGPCTEIFYDHGEDVFGGPPGSPDEDGDRYIEIWNLVFMQFNRDKDGSMHPLPKPSVDTGMGLERLAAILQNVHSNYEIDMFQRLIAVAAQLTNTKDLAHKSLRVIADHIRSCSFLIVDGVTPSNEGRGYVLRRIIRRALRHGHQLGQDKAFFNKLVATLVEQMGDAYPELVKSQAIVEQVLSLEEERFSETLDQGMKILEDDIASLDGKTISGETIFKLYDTYGFPADLTADIARERDLELDMTGFERCMEEQRNRARAASKFDMDYNKDIKLDTNTEFTGYEHLSSQGAVKAIIKGGELVDEISAGDEAVVVLDSTPFYAESGGQVGDTGFLSAANTQFEVMDTQKQGAAFAHIGSLVNGTIKVGDNLEAGIDAGRRTATIRNHSATHLMHAALRKVLGDHVQQKGSLVDPYKLRFDFSHFESITALQLTNIESLVNDEIRKNLAADSEVMAIDAAKAKGAMALFGEKYGDEVRVVSMGDFSIELCGGVHVNRTGDIGLFKIVSESGVASGVRRIEALTGNIALDWVEALERQLNKLASLTKSSADDVEEKVQQLIERVKSQEKELEQLKSKLASAAGNDLSSQVVEINGIKVLSAKVEADGKALMVLLDQLKNKLGSAIIVLGAANNGKVSLIAGVTKDLTAKVKAGEIVNAVAMQVGGKGGGRPDMAQAGGTQPENLDAAMASVADWVQQNTAS